jgi:hypothetical protein
MTQVTQPRISLPTPRPAVIGAALAAVALAAVILVLALSAGSKEDAQPASVGAQPSLRSDGGPEETSVAVSAGSHQAIAAPDESHTAAAVAGR